MFQLTISQSRRSVGAVKTFEIDFNASSSYYLPVFHWPLTRARGLDCETVDALFIIGIYLCLAGKLSDV